MEIDQGELQAAIERRVVNAYPIQSRIPDLIAAGRIFLRRDDLRWPKAA